MIQVETAPYAFYFTQVSGWCSSLRYKIIKYDRNNGRISEIQDGERTDFRESEAIAIKDCIYHFTRPCRHYYRKSEFYKY